MRSRRFRRRVANFLTGSIVATLLHVAGHARASNSEPDFARLAATALQRIEAANASVATTERTSAGADDAESERLVFARVVARGIGATEFAALHERRGRRADSSLQLLPVERRLVLACLQLDFDYARRLGCLQLAERELARIHPWIGVDDSVLWADLVERAAAMDYHDEPEVPDGEDLLGLASAGLPDAAVFAAAEKLARAFPDHLRAHLPRLILYRRAGREADLDRAIEEFQRLAPGNRSLRSLARDIRRTFSPFNPATPRHATHPRSG